MFMTVRRIAVWIASAAAGAAATVGTIYAFNTTLEKFALSNAILVFLSIGAFTFIWADFLLKTDYLKR
jgi:hypothetical protein